MNLTDKTIVITGGARGLGGAMADRLARAGAKLALVDLDPDALEATAEACRDAGAPDVRTYVCNVAVEGEVESLFESVIADFGALDGLVNNAGITRDAMLLKFKDGELISKMTLEQ